MEGGKYSRYMHNRVLYVCSVSGPSLHVNVIALQYNMQ